MAGPAAGRGVAGAAIRLGGLWLGFSLLPALRAATAPAEAVAAPAAAIVRVAAMRPQTAAALLPPRPRAEDNAAPLLMEAVAALETENVWDTTLATLATEAYSSGYSAPAGMNLVGLVEALHLPAECNRSPTVDEVCGEFERRLDGTAARQALALCAQAAARPRCWFDLDYSLGPNLQLPHLATLRNLARFLAASAYALAERGEGPAAWACIVPQLQIADFLREEPLLITQLVRIAVAKTALATLQEVAALTPPEAATYQHLDALLDRLDDAAPLVAAIDGERLLLGEWVFSQPPEKVVELLKASGEVKDAPALTAAQLAAERAVYTAAVLHLADLAGQPYYQVKDDLARAPGSPGNADAVMASVVARSLLPVLATCCGKAAACQATVRVARFGLRLMAYRAEQGAYPARLDGLQLADVAPAKQLDPFTGKALCYRLEGNGFVLYSVGLDGTDNGGTPRQGDAQQDLDIVWRATR